MAKRRIKGHQQGLHHQISLWMMVWSLFASIGCPFWCDNTPDSPFATPALGASASRTPNSTADGINPRIATTPAAKARAGAVPQASAVLALSSFNSFDFDEFCQCACQQVARPVSSSIWAPPLAFVTPNPRSILFQSAIYGRAGPPNPHALAPRTTLRRSSLLGRAPPLSV